MTADHPRAWALSAACWLAALEATALIVAVAWSGKRAAPALIVFVAVKLPFCWLAARVRPAGYLALMLWELAGVVAAFAARGTSPALRGVEIAVALTVMGLLAAATPMFPSVQLPDSRSM